MSIQDHGPRPNAFDIETATVQNENYRVVAWTGKYLQVTLMSILPGESIGLEVHPATDQFLRIEAGSGRCVMGSEKDALDFEVKVAAGWSVQVPAGTWHDVINTGTEPLRLYTVYAPSHHASGAIQPTQEDAKREEESGADEPPEWTAQRGSAVPDEDG